MPKGPQGQKRMRDVADRLANRVQLTTDGHGVYGSPSFFGSILDIIARFFTRTVR